MASKLFTERMGRGAHLLPFLEEELRAVSAVSKDANKSVESHLHLLFPPVQGKNTTNVQSYNKNESLYIPENKFAGDIFYLCVENLEPYTKNSLTFWDMMNLLNIETRVQKWFKYQNYKEKKLVDIVPDIIQKYYANDIGVTIELTSSDNKSSTSWFFKKVLRPSFLSRRKSLKSLKLSSKSAKKRRVLKNKSKNKRSAKSRRR